MLTNTAGAGAHWRQALEAWTIPEEIRAQAPEDPWALPVSFSAMVATSQ